MTSVKIWEEDVSIPTYKIHSAEKAPLFLEKRAYQGSTGKVYPLPVTEKVSDVCREVAYHAVWLENEYLRVTVLPELGGRIYAVVDKTTGYDLVYRNHVNAAIDQSEQGVIAADADALTRMDVGAALTDQDVAGQNKLTVAALDAEALGLGITTVLGRTYAFFMCHCNLPP